jgi:hypothetical protein
VILGWLVMCLVCFVQLIVVGAWLGLPVRLL